MISMGDWVLLSNVVYLGNHFEALLKLTTISMKIKLHNYTKPSVKYEEKICWSYSNISFFFIPFLFLKMPQSLTEAWLVDCDCESEKKLLPHLSESESIRLTI